MIEDLHAKARKLNAEREEIIGRTLLLKKELNELEINLGKLDQELEENYAQQEHFWPAFNNNDEIIKVDTIEHYYQMYPDTPLSRIGNIFNVSLHVASYRISKMLSKKAA